MLLSRSASAPRKRAPHARRRALSRMAAPASASDAFEDRLAAALAEAARASSDAREAAAAAQRAAQAAASAALKAEELLALAGQASWPPLPHDVSRRVLPRRIVIIRHGESAGNLDESLYCRVPDPEIPLTHRGYEQGLEAGRQLRALVQQDEAESGCEGRLFLYVSPYRRSKQTAAAIIAAFPRTSVMGLREEPQLREQDFGNFQDLSLKKREKEERLAFGRFWYRFPDGESGSDVYDRITIFEDHVVRDIDAGRFPEGTTLVIVTHGLTLRIFLARWLHWTVSEYESVFNPPNCALVVLERASAAPHAAEECVVDGSACDPEALNHTKNLYRLTDESLAMLGVLSAPGGPEASASHCLSSMCFPEQAWERVLRSDGHWDEGSTEALCALQPADFERRPRESDK